MRIIIRKSVSPAFLAVVLIVSMILSSCTNPVPPEKTDYVGEWRSQEMYLLILADGTVHYERLKGGGSVEITGPIKAFEGDDFVVGFLFITTTFTVDRPPFQDNNEWYMVVDGVQLTRNDE
ncbi:MAG: hypothetical protein D6B25_16265 [Desulfobulbaceae bacterium]|nr:MAG: hypothetical protein D6B25_16265 [Desulfobulbaceae bacterium]